MSHSICHFGPNQNLINLIKHTPGNTLLSFNHLCYLACKVKQLCVEQFGDQFHLVMGLVLEFFVASKDPVKFEDAWMVNGKCTALL